MLLGRSSGGVVLPPTFFATHLTMYVGVDLHCPSLIFGRSQTSIRDTVVDCSSSQHAPDDSMSDPTKCPQMTGLIGSC